MKTALFALALVFAGPAQAVQEYILPTLFDVSGVAEDDVLNIRAAPSTSAEIIGTLAPNATRVEVVAHDESGQWGQVNTNGRSGWASMHYLSYRTDVWQEGRVPRTLRCLGTEPFWSLRPDGQHLVYDTPEAERRLALDAVLSPDLMRSPRRALTGSDEDGRVVATIVPAACSDAMSDRAYGLDATVVLMGETQRMLSGCCTIGE